MALNAEHQGFLNVFEHGNRYDLDDPSMLSLPDSEGNLTPSGMNARQFTDFQQNYGAARKDDDSFMGAFKDMRGGLSIASLPFTVGGMNDLAMNFGGPQMPPAIFDTLPGASMPMAVPPADPTFGGALKDMGGGFFSGVNGSGMLNNSMTMDPSLFSGDMPGFNLSGMENLLGDNFAGGASSAGGAIPSDLINGGGLPGNGFPASYLPGENSGIDDLLKKLGLKRPGGGPLSMGMQGLSLIMGLSRMGQMDKLANLAQQPPQTRMATFDPMGYGPRAQYLQQMNDLRADPSRVANLPGYNAGLDAITRKLAAAGYLGSGNMKSELLDYGGKAYDSEMSRLATLSGSTMPIQNTVVSSDPRAAIAAAAGNNDMLSKVLASGGFFARSLDDQLFGKGK